MLFEESFRISPWLYAVAVTQLPFQVPTAWVAFTSPVVESNEIKPILLEQLYKPVRWVDTINTIHSLGVIKIIECGPGKVLCGLIKRIENSFKLFSIQDQTSLENSLV